jgi:YQGE family putative transporter
MEKDKNLKRFLLTIVLFMAASILSDAFANIYLWRIKADYIPITLYLLACYFTIPVIFYLCGYIGMRIDRVTIYIIGIFCYITFYGMVLLFRENIGQQVILWGFVKGLAMGFFFFGYHILTFDFTSTSNRDLFYTNTTVISGACSLLGPMTAGLIITHFRNFSGYYIIFGCSAVLYMAAVALSFSMKSKPIKKPYKVEDLIFTKNKKWQDTMIAYLFLSGKDTIATFLITILVFKSTVNELKVGIYSALASIAAITAALLLGRFSKPQTRKSYVLTGAILAFASAFLLIYAINIYTLIAYGIISAVADYLVRTPISAHALDVISLDVNAHERKMEYIVARDIPTAVARITMLVVFVLFLQYMPVNGIKAIILLISMFPFGVYWAMYMR